MFTDARPRRALAAVSLTLALIYVSASAAADGAPPPFQMPKASESVPRPGDLVPSGAPDRVETRQYGNARVEIEYYGDDTVQHVFPPASAGDSSGPAPDDAQAEAMCVPGDIEPNTGSPPRISGTPSPGGVLEVSNGSWVVCGQFSVSYSYRWSTGATTKTYAVQSGDVGRQINATVTACTSEDCASATSNTVTITDSGGGGGGGSGNPCAENSSTQLYSQFVGMTQPPASVTVGQSFSVSITFQNAGQCTWTAEGGYRLGSQNPENNTSWGLNRVGLAAGESIAPGQSKTFVVNATAPSTTGTYGFQWRMVREGVNWFGPSTPNATINVTASSSPPPEYDDPGVEAEVETGDRGLSHSTGERCFWATWKDDKGSFVYYRKVYQRVEWCSKGGHITRYSVTQWPTNATLCSPVWGPASSLIAGGVGSGSVTILTRGGFKCDFPEPLPDPTDYVEVDVRYHYDGRRQDV